MKCVHCQHVVHDEDSQCPYCGCPIFSSAPEQAQQSRYQKQIQQAFEDGSQTSKVIHFPKQPQASNAITPHQITLSLWSIIGFGLTAIFGLMFIFALDLFAYWHSWLILVMMLSLFVVAARNEEQPKPTRQTTTPSTTVPPLDVDDIDTNFN